AIPDGVILQHANDLQPRWLRIRVPFNAHTYLAHDAHGCRILIGCRRDDALEPEVLESIVNQRLGSFGRIALAPEGCTSSMENGRITSRRVSSVGMGIITRSLL